MGAETARWLYVGAILAYGTVVFIALTGAIRQGKPMSAWLWAWMASPIPLLLVARGFEGRGILHLVDPGIQSWAFLFGDFIFLPFMASMLALAWRRLNVRRAPDLSDALRYRIEELERPGHRQHRPVRWTRPRKWYASVWWRLFAGLLGLAAGLTFHWVDGVNYTGLALNSPAKLLHDIVSYSVLFGALNYGLWPALLTRGARRLALVSLIGFALWLGGGVADNTFHKLDGRNLHIQYDWEHMRPLPY